MWDILLWVYLINAVLLILHEIDSAYWKEWELFRLPGGVTAFLLVHIPILLLVLYGLVLVAQRTAAGLVLSLILGLAGVFAFSIHAYFIRRGRDEFKSPISLAILVATFVLSLVQIAISIYALGRG
jgi:chromate transport protein ChrA